MSRRTLLLLTVLGLLVSALGWRVATVGPRAVVTVGPRDTLQRVARRNRVKVAQLREWNHLGRGPVAPGTPLFLAPPPTWQQRLAAAFSMPSARRPDPQQPPSPPGATAARRSPRTVRFRPPARPPQAATEDPTAEAEVAVQAASVPPLEMPPAQPCLTDPGEAEPQAAGVAVTRSAGLSEAQVHAAIRSIQSEVSRCYPGHGSVSGSLLLELAVGCDGRVQSATAAEQDIGDAEFVACVLDVFRHTPFASHGREEVIVQIPLRFDPAPASVEGGPPAQDGT